MSTELKIKVDNKELEELIENLKLCFAQVKEKKMRIMDRIGFEYKGRHYVFYRDE
jgi:hypothetical protein